MTLDGFILHALLKDIRQACPFKINKVQQVGQYHFAFHAFAKQRFTLYLVLDPQSSRFVITHDVFTQTHQSPFLTTLKKNCEGAICTQVLQSGMDRHFHLVLNTTNDVFEKIQMRLYIELMGAYTNAIMVNEHNTIVDAYTKIYPDKNSQRFIMNHAPFQPIPTQSKIQFNDPQLREKISSWMDIEGCSPLLAKELTFRSHMQENIIDVLHTCANSTTLYVNERQQFHVIPLLHTNSNYTSGECHSMIQRVYAQQDLQKNIKVLTNNIAQSITRELKKQRLKALKLESDLLTSHKSETYRLWADYCMTYGNSIKKGDQHIIAPTFEDETQTITIALQPHLSGIENASAYYKKAAKLKQSIHHIHEQLALTHTMITYLESCESALTFANIEEAMQIKEELSAHKIIQTKRCDKPKPKKYMWRILCYKDPDFSIYIGKNNIQNDHLTFTFAHKNDYWFHVKDAPSSHVILKTPKELNETMIRTAANLCALYSKHAQSSSVEVMYTTISNIKKVPKAPLGLVSVKHYVTIFIDPDKTILPSLHYEKG